MLRDDVLIENNKYGCVIMQNNGAMKIINFMHAQMAETRCSFLRLQTLGTRLATSYAWWEGGGGMQSPPRHQHISAFDCIIAALAGYGVHCRNL